MGIRDELRRLISPYEDEDEYEEEETEEAATPISQERSRSKPSDAEYSSVSASQSARAAAPEDRSRKVVNIHTTTQLQVILVRPREFDDASEIANHLRDKRTVVMNLEDADDKTARRLVDFLSGVAYAQEGKIKKVAIATYIITPYNVDIIGDKDILDELESSGAYTFQ